MPSKDPILHALLDDLYRMSSGEDARVLLWALQLVRDEGFQLSQLADEVHRRGGPSATAVRATLKRLGVRGA